MGDGKNVFSIEISGRNAFRTVVHNNQACTVEKHPASRVNQNRQVMNVVETVCVVTGSALGSVIFLVLCARVYTRWHMRKCRSKASLLGKTAVVTGANTGIGFWTALDFAKRQGRVVIACRNVDKGTEAVERIIRETGNRNVVLRQLDLSSLKSVRKFAEEIINEEKRLNILVNNAAVAGLKEKYMTEDGLELTYATNHFGPFLLTNLLLDLMKRSAPSRIVNVAAFIHKFGTIRFDNLKSEIQYERMMTYSHTKLANILFTRELARRLEGTGVTTYCLHPGVVKTEITRNASKFMQVLGVHVFGTAKKSGEDGAQTTIYCAVSEEVEGASGRYYDECQEAMVSRQAQDDGVAKKLWDISEKYTGLCS